MAIVEQQRAVTRQAEIADFMVSDVDLMMGAMTNKHPWQV